MEKISGFYSWKSKMVFSPSDIFFQSFAIWLCSAILNSGHQGLSCWHELSCRDSWKTGYNLAWFYASFKMPERGSLFLNHLIDLLLSIYFFKLSDRKYASVWFSAQFIDNTKFFWDIRFPKAFFKISLLPSSMLIWHHETKDNRAMSSIVCVNGNEAPVFCPGKSHIKQSCWFCEIFGSKFFVLPWSQGGRHPK